MVHRTFRVSQLKTRLNLIEEGKWTSRRVSFEMLSVSGECVEVLYIKMLRMYLKTSALYAQPIFPYRSLFFSLFC